ncbi:XkdF-like putative serine protease domain-containing protein [Flavobacterium sp. SORGH_AS_0622]|uniref:XkdF-like putative serine protease domain-containing protein n=1 Tax=Flavobacterium sp. SORGH_AS_0622 TaxID=3041772 RepID=UPI002781185C|nr:XkdF-like putative serine protease domain-containing protein [Flavobacterium sp. SORGH_AS_0622]MDQ1165908.1 hypothetical protein [Flavobacterium sp. SORGH_AS_0622]
MKKYELVFNNEEQGVFRVSLVKDPAIESTLLHFNAEKPQIFHFTQDEMQIVYAPAMIPNKLIFRADVNGENAQVFYTSDTIDQLQKNYFKNGHNSTTNINHQTEDTTGVYPFESWIVQDPINDKSNAMGFDVPAGTWMMGYKIDNDQVWQDVKSGNLDGLSIEARLGFKEVNNNENYNKQTMNKKSILKTITDFFMANEDKKEFESGDKKVFAIELKEGEILTDEAGEPIANATVEIDSKLYKTDDLGTITAIEEKASEEKQDAEEMADEKTTEEAPTESEAETQEPVKAPQEDLKAENEQLKKDLATAQEELAKLQAEKIKADTELTEMKAQTPATEAIKNVPPAITKSYDEMSNYEKMQYNKGK